MRSIITLAFLMSSLVLQSAPFRGGKHGHHMTRIRGRSEPIVSPSWKNLLVLLITILTFTSHAKAQDLYVSDGQATIRKISPSGQVSIYASGLNAAAALAFDSRGNLHAANGFSIARLSPGSGVTQIGTNSVNVRGLAFDRKGNIYITDGLSLGHVYRISPDGVIKTLYSGLGQLFALTVDGNGTVYVANTSDRAVLKIDSQGRASTFAQGFQSVAGLALDRGGNLYVSDAEKNTISKITPQGVAREFARGKGTDLTSSASGLNKPVALAFDRAGNLYVANTGNGTISKITPAGKASTFAQGLGFPAGLAFTGGTPFPVATTAPKKPVKPAAKPAPEPPLRQTLYVSDKTGSTVRKITPDGKVTTFATGFNGPAGMAFDSHGNLYVANYALENASPTDVRSGTISKVSPTGEVTDYVSGLRAPYSMFIDELDHIYVTVRAGLSSSTGIHFIMSPGERWKLPVEISDPSSITRGIDLKLYVTDQQTGTIYKMSPRGPATIVVGNLNQPTALAIDRKNAIYFSNTEDTLWVFTSTKVLKPFVEKPKAPQGALGVPALGTNGIAAPAAMTFDEHGNLYVANSANGTVTKISRSGKVSQFASGLGTPGGLVFGPPPSTSSTRTSP